MQHCHIEMKSKNGFYLLGYFVQGMSEVLKLWGAFPVGGLLCEEHVYFE
jgi:hypothetical protein